MSPTDQSETATSAKQISEKSLDISKMNITSFDEYPFENRCTAIKDLLMFVANMLGNEVSVKVKKQCQKISLPNSTGYLFNFSLEKEDDSISFEIKKIGSNISLSRLEGSTKHVQSTRNIDPIVKDFDPKLIQLKATLDQFFTNTNATPNIYGVSMDEWVKQAFDQENRKYKKIRYLDYSGQYSTIDVQILLIPESDTNKQRGIIRFSSNADLEMGDEPSTPLSKANRLFSYGILGCLNISCLNEVDNPITYEIQGARLLMARQTSQAASTYLSWHIKTD